MPAEWFIPVSQTVCVAHFTSSMQQKESRLHSIFGGSWSKLAMRVVVVLGFIGAQKLSVLSSRCFSSFRRVVEVHGGRSFAFSKERSRGFHWYMCKANE